MNLAPDPRVLFAAERTLLAWNRTCLAWMGFGFIVQRADLFLPLGTVSEMQRVLSFWVGALFVLVGSLGAFVVALQFRRVLSGLRPEEIPERYPVNLASGANFGLAVFGLLVLAHGFL